MPHLKMRIEYENEDGETVESCHCMKDFDREYAHALLDEFLDAYEEGGVHKDSTHDWPHEIYFTPCTVHT